MNVVDVDVRFLQRASHVLISLDDFHQHRPGPTSEMTTRVHTSQPYTWADSAICVHVGWAIF
jgi:hypothetical protein